jgi:hypothetical protein
VLPAIAILYPVTTTPATHTYPLSDTFSLLILINPSHEEKRKVCRKEAGDAFNFRIRVRTPISCVPYIVRSSSPRIARNVKHFETWSSCQACEQVAFSDLPLALKDEVMAVFDVERRLPISLVREVRALVTLI